MAGCGLAEPADFPGPGRDVTEPIQGTDFFHGLLCKAANCRSPRSAPLGRTRKTGETPPEKRAAQVGAVWEIVGRIRGDRGLVLSNDGRGELMERPFRSPVRDRGSPSGVGARP